MRISDWSSDVCSSDLPGKADHAVAQLLAHAFAVQRQRRKGVGLLAEDEQADAVTGAAVEEVGDHRLGGGEAVADGVAEGHVLLAHAAGQVDGQHQVAPGLRRLHRFAQLLRTRSRHAQQQPRQPQPPRRPAAATSPTPSVSSPSTPSRPPIPAIRACRWAWPTSPRCSGTTTWATTPTIRSGSTATASCSPTGTARCCSTRCCPCPATTCRSSRSSGFASSNRRPPAIPRNSCPRAWIPPPAHPARASPTPRTSPSPTTCPPP